MINELHKSLLIAVCVLAFTCVIFFFKFAAEKAHNSTLQAEHDAQMEVGTKEVESAHQKAVIAEKKAQIFADNQKKESQARNMLDKMHASSEAEKKAEIDLLNQRLEREADARMKAEDASKELAEQKKILDLSIAQTLETIEKLRNEKTSDTNKRIAEYKKLLKEKELEIEKLKAEHERLEKLRIAAELAQLATQKEIEEKGGRITLHRNKRLLSPNIRSN